MKRRIIFTVSVFVATLLLMAVQKPLFMAFNISLAAGTSVADWFAVIWHGLRLDCTVAGYITLLPALVAMLSVLFPSRVWRTVLRVYFALVSLFVAAVFSSDLGLYAAWGYRLDNSVLFYLRTPAEAMASVTAAQIVLHTAIFLIYGGVLYVAYHFLCCILPDTTVTHRATWCGVMFLLTAMLVIPMRGGFSVATANVSNAYFSSNMFLNHSAVNPVFSFLSSLGDKEEQTTRYDMLSDAAIKAIVSPLMPRYGATTDTLLRTERPNIVLIIMESFGRSFTDATVDGKPLCPNIMRLRGEGVWFENMYANSFRTDRGTVSVVSGFPSQPTMSIMKNPSKSRHLPSVAVALDSVGYVSSFMYGGDLNFTNTASYLYSMGYTELTAQKDMHLASPVSKWGYADDAVCRLFAQQYESKSQSGKPFFATLLTLSSHEPFDVPMHRLKDPLLNSVCFADSCVGAMIDRMKASSSWSNTLVIIVADHAYRYPYGIENSSVARYRIPMLWLGGALREPREVDTYCSQIDIAPTVLAQMGLPQTAFRFGHNIFSNDSHYGCFTFKDGAGYVDASSASVWDYTAGAAVTADTTSVRRAQALVQQTYRAIRNL